VEGRTALVVSSKARGSPAKAGIVPREKADAKAEVKAEAVRKVVGILIPLQAEAARGVEQAQAGAPIVRAAPFAELRPGWSKSRFHFLGPSILSLSFLDFGGVLSRMDSWFLSYLVKIPERKLR